MERLAIVFLAVFGAVYVWMFLIDLATERARKRARSICSAMKLHRSALCAGFTFDAVEARLLELQRVNGAEAQRVRAFVERTMRGVYAKWLQSRRRDSRMRAYEACAQFRIRSLEHELQGQLTKLEARRGENYAVLAALAALGDARLDEWLAVYGDDLTPIQLQRIAWKRVRR